MAHIHGHERTAYFNPEATFNTVATPAAGDAVRTTSAEFGAEMGTATPNDRTGTLDEMERIATRTPEQSWSLSGIVRPSGTLGTAPDIGNILTHVLGTETVQASTDVAYTLLEDKTSLSATIMSINSNDLLQGVSGAVVQNFSLNWTGEDWITWTADGVAADYIQAGRTLTDQAGNVAATETTVVVDDASFFTVGGIFEAVNPSTEVTIDDNSGAGYRITAISGQTLTFTPGAVVGWSDNDLIVPFLPAGTFAGDPLFGTDGSVSLDNGSSTITTESGSLTLATGLGLINSTFGGTVASGVRLMGKRTNTGTLSMLMEQANTYYMQDFRANTAYDVQIILGDTAAKRCKINMNNTFFTPDGIPSAEVDTLTWSVNFETRGTSGEDSIDLLWD